MHIARVNNYNISKKEYQAELYQIMNQRKTKKISKKIKELAINNLIDAYLLLEECKKQNLSIDEQKVQLSFRQIRNNYNSEEEFYNDLKKYSFTPDRLLSNIRNYIKIQKYVQVNFIRKNNFKIDVLRDYYQNHKKNFEKPEEIRLCHLLIRKEDPTAYEKIEEITNNLNKEDFCSLVKKYSQCPSIKNDGDLGYIARGSLIKKMEDIAFSLSIGQIGGPIQTKFGYHFIKILDKKPPQVPVFNEIKDSLQKQLKKIISELELLKLIRQLRQKADITINKDLL